MNLNEILLFVAWVVMWICWFFIQRKNSKLNKELAKLRRNIHRINFQAYGAGKSSHALETFILSVKREIIKAVKEKNYEKTCYAYIFGKDTHCCVTIEHRKPFQEIEITMDEVK